MNANERVIALHRCIATGVPSVTWFDQFREFRNDLFLQLLRFDVDQIFAVRQAHVVGRSPIHLHHRKWSRISQLKSYRKQLYADSMGKVTCVGMGQTHPKSSSLLHGKPFMEPQPESIINYNLLVFFKNAF